MEAWHESQQESEVRLVEKSEAADAKGFQEGEEVVRTHRPRHNASLLAAAAAAVKAAFLLTGRAARPSGECGGPSGQDPGRMPLEEITPDDLERMTPEQRGTSPGTVPGRPRVWAWIDIDRRFFRPNRQEPRRQALPRPSPGGRGGPANWTASPLEKTGRLMTGK